MSSLAREDTTDVQSVGNGSRATTESVASGVVATERESEVRSYSRSFDATFRSAFGSVMVDVSGRRFIDFLAGCSALNYGHNDADMIEAVVTYLASGGVVHGLDMRTEAKAEFIELFTEHVLLPRAMPHKLQFTGPTGTNAVEAALKLARKVTGRTSVVAFTNGFHGVSLGALAATGNGHNRMGPAIPLVGVQRALYDGYLGPDVDTAGLLDQLLSDPSSGFDPPAAVLLETVQGEGGLNVASPGWLRRIAEITRRNGALLIVDDIQAGCGRTGPFFSFEPADVQPDLITLSKSLSGLGLPLSLVLIHPDHDVWTAGEHNGTFRGNNLAFVAAATTLRKFWVQSALERDVARRAGIVRRALEETARLLPGSRHKGLGLMQGLDTGSTEIAHAVTRRCFDNGLIIETSGPHDEVVKILPPLTTPDDLLEEGLAIVHDAVASVAAQPIWPTSVVRPAARRSPAAE